MPNEYPGSQQVYGAQHPPSIKLIRELTNNSSSGGNAGSASGASTISGGSGLPSTFRDYEKKTNDAWNIDADDDLSNNGRMFTFPVDQLPISVADSAAVAQQIIKSHQEKQKTSSSAFDFASSPSPPAKTSLRGSGPGKALRQGAASSQQSSTQSITKQQQQPTSLSSPTSISSDKFVSLNQKLNEEKADLRLSSQPAKTIVSSVIKVELEPKSNAIVATTASNGSRQITSSTTPGLNREAEDELARLEKFKRLLGVNPIDLNELQRACWKGIPRLYRHICWKLLSDYLPLNLELQEKTVEQKRQAYWEAVTIHYGDTFIEGHHDMLRQILNDIPRMNPLLPIFQNKIIQDIFQRVLYVWAVRHPGTGYVQGINDLLTPFFVVFLAEYTDIEIQNLNIETISESNRRNLEADCYWCMNKLLERIQENYVCSQPGIQKNIRHLEYLIKRIDVNLYNHLKKNNIEFIQFAFRWMNNLLMREIPLSCTIRLWDTYHAEPFGFSDFHLYVCAAFLLRFSKNLLQENDFQGLMMTLQNLPTKNLKASDIELLTAEAYQLQVMFANSPNHTSN